jgi:competence protein ComEC
MNLYIERLDGVSFSVWNGFSISILQVVFLYGIIAGTACWLLERKKAAAWLALFFVLAFTSLRTYSFLKANEQLELIVYNVPKHSAIDVIKGRGYFFIGDSNLVQDGFLRNFHLQPSRLMHRVSALGVLPYKSFLFYDRRFMIIDTTIKFLPATRKPAVDVLILSRKPRLNISDLQNAFYFKQIVVDGSVPAWKKGLWKKECDSLRIPYYDVSEKGAFVMKMR